MAGTLLIPFGIERIPYEIAGYGIAFINEAAKRISELPAAVLAGASLNVSAQSGSEKSQDLKKQVLAEKSSIMVILLLVNQHMRLPIWALRERSKTFGFLMTYQFLTMYSQHVKTIFLITCLMAFCVRNAAGNKKR